MPQISGLSFDVKLEPHLPTRLTVVDTTLSIPSGFVGIFKVVQPDGYVRSGDINSPDVDTVTRLKLIPIIADSTGNIQQGQYTIEFTGNAPGYLSTTFIRTFTFQYTPAAITLRNDFDLFTPELAYADISNYNISGYTVTSGPTRKWDATSPTTGLISSSNSSIDIKFNNKYYAENYTIDFKVSVGYVHQTYPWLTVLHNMEKTVLVTACVPKSMEELTQAVEALRLESNESCGGDWARFEKANSLYVHLINMLRLVLIAGEQQAGFFDAYQQLLTYIQNGSVSCSSIGQEILPYDFSDYESSIYDGESSYCTLVGDNINTVYRVNHNLGDKCVVVQVYEVATGKQVFCDIAVATNNAIDITFYEPPTLNQYRVVAMVGAIGLRGEGLQPGGLAGEVLRKKSNIDFDTEWVAITPPEMVPYVGAIKDVDLGEFGLKTGNLEFDLTPTDAPVTAGSMSWNDSDGTLDLKLKGGNVTLQVGQEMVTRVVNKTGADLLESQYRAVRIRKVDEGGAQGQRLAVVLAQANTEYSSTDMMGVVTENISNNQEGFITTFGTVRGINTTGSLQGETWLDGDIIFLSPSSPGGLTKVEPSAPNHLIIVGYVEYAHANNGKLFIHVQTSWEIDELHNVAISNPQNNDILKYNSTTGVWYNTPAPTGGVTSVGLSTTTSGVTIGSTPVTSSGVITINIATATASTNGLLSSTDWTAFSSKIGGSGTTNYIPKFTAAGTIGNSQIFDNGTYIGINKATPSAMLDIIGKSAVATIRYTGRSSDNSTTLDWYSNDGATRYAFQYVDGTIFQNVAVANMPMTFGTNNAERMRITATGNVGIGTTSPSSKLQIYTETSTQVGLSLYSANATAERITYTASPGLELSSYQGAAGSPFTKISDIVANADGTVPSVMRLWTKASGASSPTERMRIAADGNVGIGTTSPNKKLVINATANAAFASGSGISVDYTGSTNGVIIPLGFSWSGSTGNQNTLWGMGLITTDFANGYGDLGFYTGTVQHMRITRTGNVGIGLSDPAEKLQVAGNIRIQNETGLITNLGTLAGLYNTSQVYIGTGSYSMVKIARADGGGLNALSGGNVGVGTTTPVSKLQVIGDVVFNSTGAGDGSNALLINNSFATPVLRIGAAGGIIMNTATKIKTTLGDSSTTPYIQLYNNGTGNTNIQSSTSYALVLQPEGGNVGIGTTTPGSRLDVFDSGYSIVRITGGSGGYFDSYNSSGTRLASFGAESNGDTYFGSRGNNPIITIVNGSERMRIHNTGNLSINSVTDAGYKLDIAGSLRNTTGANLATSSGNVGIGTSSPSQKLHVLGGNLLVQRAYSSGNIPLEILNSAVPSKGQSYDVGFFQSNDAPSLRITEVNSADNSIVGELTLSAGDGNVQLIGGTGEMVFNAGRANSSAGYIVGTNHLRIFANGRVGINTTSDAGYQLDIAGSLRNTTGANFATSSGNVGIGTTTPSLLLQVAARGGMGSDGVFYWGSALTGNSRGQLSYDTDRAIIYSPLNITFTNGVSNTERMRIDSGGNVGIGTTTPTYKLHLPDAGVTANQAMIAGTVFGTDGNGMTIQPSDSRALSIIGQGGYGKLYTGVFGGVGKWGINTTMVDASVLNLNGNMTIGSSYLGTAAPVNGMIIEGVVAIGASTAAASAKLEVASTTQGFLPPRMTSSQRTAISSPATGLVVYQTDGTEGLYIRTASAWSLLAVV